VLLGSHDQLGTREEIKAQLRSYGSPPDFDGVGLLVLDDSGPRLLRRQADDAVPRRVGTMPTTRHGKLVDRLDKEASKQWAVVRAVSFTHESRIPRRRDLR